jgi:hypothetical protein
MQQKGELALEPVLRFPQALKIDSTCSKCLGIFSAQFVSAKFHNSLY